MTKHHCQECGKELPLHSVAQHYLPLATVVSLVSGVIWLTVLLQGLSEQIRALRTEVRYEQQMTGDRVGRVEATCWTKADHRIWAAQVGLKEGNP